LRRQSTRSKSTRRKSLVRGGHSLHHYEHVSNIGKVSGSYKRLVREAPYVPRNNSSGSYNRRAATLGRRGIKKGNVTALIAKFMKKPA